MNARVTSLVSTALLLIAPNMARGQEDTRGVEALSEAEQQALLVHLREAREAYERGEYERALTSYESAYRIEALASIWFFRGQILERLERDDEALAAYERFISEAPEDERVTLATRTIEVLRERRRARQQVTFQIVTDPPGAHITWQEDGEQLYEGESPLSVPTQVGKTLTFTAAHPGFEPVRREVTFEQGGTLIWEPTLRPIEEVAEQPAELRPQHESPRALWIGAGSAASVSMAAFLIAASAGRRLDEADARRGEPDFRRPENYDALRSRHNAGVTIGWLGAVGAATCAGIALFEATRDTSPKRAWQADVRVTGAHVGVRLSASF